MTKGKWEVIPDNDDVRRESVQMDGTLIATIWAEGEFRHIKTAKETQSNAKLIALAGNLAQKFNLEEIENCLEKTLELSRCCIPCKMANRLGQIESALKSLKKATEGH